MTPAPHRLRRATTTLTAAFLLAGAALSAQDTVRPPAPPPPSPGTATRINARLLVSFRPPARGVRREPARTSGGNGARAVLPSPAVDTMIGQTLRDAPYVAVCAGGQPDSARLTVRIRDTVSSVMIALRPGLNRIPLAGAHVPLNDGDVAEWSLSTPSGEEFLHEFIQRLVVPSTPTVAALARNGIWYDVLDLFVLDAVRGIPLASERLETFLISVGGSTCSVEPPPP